MLRTNLTTLFRGILIGIVGCSLLLPLAPLHAQSGPTIEVQVVITGIAATDLNEDVPVIDDGEDEMLFFYDLYEVDADGRVLQQASATTDYAFDRGERASGSAFDVLRLVVAPSSRVIFVLKAVEVDTSISDEDAQQCGVSNALTVAQCLVFGDCLGLLNPNLLLNCLADLGVVLVGTNDDLFEEAHVRQISAISADPELVDSNVADRGRNPANYALEYTIVRAATDEAPIRGAAAGYVFLGRLADGQDTQRWTADLRLGDTVTLWMSSTSGDLDTQLALQDTNDDIIATNDDAEGYDTTNSRLVFDVRFGAPYTIHAQRGDGDTSGDYVLEVHIN